MRSSRFQLNRARWDRRRSARIHRRCSLRRNARMNWPCQWRIFVQRQVGEGTIVIVGVGAKHAAQMCLPDNDQMIQALSSDRSDQPFDIGVLPWRAWRRRAIPDAHAFDPSLEHLPISAIAIANKVGPRIYVAWCPGSTRVAARIDWDGYRSAGMAISGACSCMVREPCCAGAAPNRARGLAGPTGSWRGGRQTWCWSPWPIRQPVSPGHCSGTSVSTDRRRHSQLANRDQIARVTTI